MNKAARFLTGVVLWFCVFMFALRVVPFFGPFDSYVKAHGWLTRGDITQVSFLILSFGLALLLNKGSLAWLGLRGAPSRLVVKAVLIAALVTLAEVVLSMVLMSLGGSPAGRGEHPAMGGGPLKIVVSVLIMASICEELFYRGLLLGYLAPLRPLGFTIFRRRVSLPVAFCALSFGLGHLCLLGMMPGRMVGMIVLAATALGLLAGHYREKTESLIPAVAVHMTFNIIGTAIPAILMGLKPA
jgi:membrane protease YdiL (CAAX protease family)